MLRKKFSFIIPFYNAESTMLNLCTSIAGFKGEKGDIEVLFVDNCSTDKSLEIIENFDFQKDLMIRVERYCVKKSSYAARNYGASLAKGDLFIFTDADCQIDSYFVDVLRGLRTNQHTILAGRIEFMFENTNNVWEKYDSYSSLRNDLTWARNQAVTANLIVSQDIFNELKGFKERQSSSDFDFTERAGNLGYTLSYEELLIVKHPTRKDIRELSAKYSRFGAGIGESLKESGSSRFVHLGLYFLRLFYLPTYLKYIKLLHQDFPIMGLLQFVIGFFRLRWSLFRGVYFELFRK